MKVDEMINSIEVVKNGHVAQLIVEGMDGVAKKFVFPFDSAPPSMVVVSREGLVRLLDEHKQVCEAFERRIDDLRRETVTQAKQLWSAASAYTAQTTVLNYLLRLTLPADKTGPLTFEQMKERVGKPVYMKHADDTTGEWHILLDAREIPWSPAREPVVSIIAGRYIKYNPGKVLYYDYE